MQKTYVINIFGDVQGVGYENYVSNLAMTKGMSGRIKNNPDGSLLVFVNCQKQPLNDLIDELKSGNEYANVSCIKVEETIKTDFEGFSVIY